MQDLVDRFNAEHDGIAVKMTTMEWADFHAKLPAALTSGQGPHIAIQHLDSLPTSAARGLLLPLDDLAEDLALTADDFIRPVWDAGIYDGARYGIPLDVHPLGFFFNTAVMADAGLDPDDPPMDREHDRARPVGAGVRVSRGAVRVATALVCGLVLGSGATVVVASWRRGTPDAARSAPTRRTSPPPRPSRSCARSSRTSRWCRVRSPGRTRSTRSCARES
jgi:hypothetical protein